MNMDIKNLIPANKIEAVRLKVLKITEMDETNNR